MGHPAPRSYLPVCKRVQPQSREMPQPLTRLHEDWHSSNAVHSALYDKIDKLDSGVRVPQTYDRNSTLCLPGPTEAMYLRWACNRGMLCSVNWGISSDTYGNGCPGIDVHGMVFGIY
ncbi:hypothetical protein SCLCIDRAFT_751105 [Scleroderma citrinum Foug A]|uniref:Uncharacterized protein n=1 Tax=Scleroderma citrinum Foug A TaxID=1036808 RepID=A0A0C3CQJ5_9AGAM|nr:hypothetical protein SCLCIDRAFT_751105 [Scleroderma citrinum Foug A]